MSGLSNTQYFKVKTEPEIQVKEVLETVYNAMVEKGYNPVNQIVGYIMSGDPTYITSFKGARSLIMKVERDELVEELLKSTSKMNPGSERNYYENNGIRLRLKTVGVAVSDAWVLLRRESKLSAENRRISCARRWPGLKR